MALETPVRSLPINVGHRWVEERANTLNSNHITCAHMHAYIPAFSGPLASDLSAPFAGCHRQTARRPSEACEVGSIPSLLRQHLLLLAVRTVETPCRTAFRPWSATGPWTDFAPFARRRTSLWRLASSSSFVAACESGHPHALSFCFPRRN